MKSRRSIALAAGAGLVVALAAPPFDLVAGLWVGMAGLALVLERAAALPAFATPARVGLTGARRGLAFGVAANLVALRFVPGVVSRFTPLPWVVGLAALVLLALFEGLRWSLAGVACETLVRARVPRPLAFAAGVYAGSFLPTMMPWTVAGGASPWPKMVQLADVCGERGVAALMALAAGLAAAGVPLLFRLGRRARGAAVAASAVIVVGAQAGYGAVRMRTLEAARSSAPHIRVALVQPGVMPALDDPPGRAPATLAALTALTLRAEAQEAELVVWPEASFPYRLARGTSREPAGVPAILQPGVRGPVLTGLLTSDRSGTDTYNSVLVASRPGGLSATYDKRHLLWFGETVPLAEHVPWVRRAFGAGLAPGDHEMTLAAGPVRAAALVCYEDTLPEAGREAASVGPNLLVNLTDDGWFAAPETELHLRMAALRSVELRRDMVRAVNGGIPSWVAATGRVLARGSADFPGVLLTAPALLELPATLYARFGDAPWALVGLVLANVAVWRTARGRALASRDP